MLNVHNLSVAFQGDYLFEAISFKLGAGDRIGLIGKNGAGKSTLLKILANEQEYDAGQIAKEKAIKILKQSGSRITCAGQCFVDDQLVSQGEMMAMVAKAK